MQLIITPPCEIHLKFGKIFTNNFKSQVINLKSFYLEQTRNYHKYDLKNLSPSLSLESYPFSSSVFGDYFLKGNFRDVLQPLNMPPPNISGMLDLTISLKKRQHLQIKITDRTPGVS